MSAEAIGALKERTGSSQLAIAKWIEGKYAGVLPANFKKQLSLQLKKLSQKGKLVQIKHSYKLSELKKPAKVVKKVVAKKASVEKKVVKAIKSPKKAIKKTVAKSTSAKIKPAKRTTVNPKKDVKVVSKAAAAIDEKKTSAPSGLKKTAKKPVEKKAVKATSTVTAAKKPPVSKKNVAKKVSTNSRKVAKVKSPVAKKSKASA